MIALGSIGDLIQKDFGAFKEQLLLDIKDACCTYNRAVATSRGFGEWKACSAMTKVYKKSKGKNDDSFEATGKFCKLLSSPEIVKVDGNRVVCEIGTYSDEGWAIPKYKSGDVLGKLLKMSARDIYYQNNLEAALGGINTL